MKTILALFLVSLAFSTQAGSLSVSFPDTCTASASGSPTTALTITCSGSVTPPVVPPAPTPIEPSMCGPLAATYIPYNWSTDNGRVFYQLMVRGQAIIYKFKTGEAQNALAEFSIAEYAGSVPTRTVVISKSPCDFNIADASLPKLVGTSGTGYFTVGVTQPRRIRLEANTQYYVNIKNENPYSNPGIDACQFGESCTYRFSMRH